MPLSTVFCISVLLTYSLVLAFSHRQSGGNPSDDKTDAIGHPRTKRTPRVVAKFLIKLLNAGLSHYKVRYLRQNYKKGTYQDAKADYFSLDAQTVSSKRGGRRVGLVGNTVATLSNRGTTLGSYSGLKAELRIYKDISDDKVDIVSTKYYTE